MVVAEKFLDNIPVEADPSWVLSFLNGDKFTVGHVRALKAITKASNQVLSNLLNITPKTLTSYANDVSKVKIDTREHILLLIALMKKGREVFGGSEDFNDWLDMQNIFLENKRPIEFLNTISGIKFIDSRLTGIQYGDNV